LKQSIKMIKVNNHTDLYNLILEQNLTVKQVNEILKNCLPQTAIFINDNHTPKIMVEILKAYFEKHKGNYEKPFFLDVDISLQ